MQNKNEILKAAADEYARAAKRESGASALSAGRALAMGLLDTSRVQAHNGAALQAAARSNAALELATACAKDALAFAEQLKEEANDREKRADEQRRAAFAKWEAAQAQQKAQKQKQKAQKQKAQKQKQKAQKATTNVVRPE